MKIISFLLFLLTTTLATAQWQVYQNLDFNESAKDSLSGLTHWRTKAFVQAASVKSDERTCLQISGTYEEDRPGYVYQQHAIKIREYVKLRVSARVNTKDVKSGHGAIYSYTKKGAQWLQYQNREVEATEGWTSVRLDIWVGPEAGILRIGASLSGEGTFLVDDFQIEEMEPEECTFDTTYLSFMQECMDLIGTYSLYKAEIDTAQLMQNWKRLADCPDSIQDVHQSLQMVLHSIDKHSFYWPVEQVQKWQNTSTDEQADIPLARGYALDEHYAYLWMPYLGSGDSVTQVLFADHLQRLIDSLDHPDLKGWVLDIRDNGGGNCWPMLAGIGPILGEGVCGYFKDEDMYESWRYQDGKSYESEEVRTQVSITPYIPYLKNPPVAVLTGERTGSSGEIVAIAFKNRPDARIIGQKTAGFSTGNVNHTLSDGSMLFLAQSTYCDRKKEVYHHGLEPEIKISEAKTTSQDPALEAALKWLRGR